jgi:hypothetical protein
MAYVVDVVLISANVIEGAITGVSGTGGIEKHGTEQGDPSPTSGKWGGDLDAVCCKRNVELPNKSSSGPSLAAARGHSDVNHDNGNLFVDNTQSYRLRIL